ncbi:MULTISPECIES: glycosyl hydrolase family 8 [Ramlibacter]|uniref:cellulase n=1 Tax=Ramlibacter aquaticus TaxID=2780094 RepID=A0ABR9SAH3_9BURK|nr:MULTISPECIES: glycosyl hydrolase family 8 [Ramlibacter]MBE7939224.1 hypothetical protein [Ramlibacter aquaticus]
MKRRLFLQSGSAAFALSIAGCGGGGGGSPAAASAASADAAAATSTAATNATPAALSRVAPVRGYPFGSRLKPYVAGIHPSVAAATMDATLAAQYDAWKAARVVAADNVVPGGKAVLFSSKYLTVSEGMGYGMLLAVVFAGHDPQAQALFDGLLAVVRARYAYGVVTYDPNGKYLMEWQLNADGSSAGGGWNAMDGDLDIAMALLMADRQWGSGGAWDYLQEAKNTIAAHKSFNFNADGASKGTRFGTNNRSSDYMVGHFRAFLAATGDTFWQLAIDKAFATLDHLQTTYAPATGLVPDFVMNTNTGDPIPSTGYIGDGNDKEGFYWWNACRDPWRFASDYVLSGDTRFALVTARMLDFFKDSTGGDPTGIGCGYTLSGTKLDANNGPAFIAPICAGGCVDARFQTFVDATWDWNTKNLTTNYYDAELQLLSLVVASGNWWSTAA